MESPIDPKKLRELVLYQAIMRRRRTPEPSISFRRVSSTPAHALYSPVDVNPGVKQIFEKLQRQVFYHSHWWSAVHANKGLLIDLFT